MEALEGGINYYYLGEFCFAVAALVSLVAFVVLCWDIWWRGE